MDQTLAVEAKFKALSPRLDEATLRLWAAAEARSLGRGGVSVVAKVAGLSRTTVYAGLAEIEAAGRSKGKRSRAAAQPVAVAAHKRVRAPGGGRKRLVDIDASLLADLDALVEPTSRGDPKSPLRWTCKSTSKLAAELQAQWGTWSARGRSLIACWPNSATVCSPTARRKKAVAILSPGCPVPAYRGSG